MTSLKTTKNSELQQQQRPDRWFVINANIYRVVDVEANQADHSVA